MPLKMDLGGSWAPFGKGLGRSGPSFGHFWMLFGNFLEVLSPPFSSIGQGWGPGGLLDRFWVDFGRFWEGLGRILGGFGHNFDRFFSFSASLGQIWDIFENI